MGLILRFGPYPTPLHVTNDGLPAFVDVDVFNRYLLQHSTGRKLRVGWGYGRIYVGFNGSGYAYIDTLNACPWVNFNNITPHQSLTGTVTLTAQHSGLTPVTGVNFT